MNVVPSGLHLRLRLLEPSCGVVTGGTRIVIHGQGFRPQPHSLLVRLRLADADSLSTSTNLSRTSKIEGKFLLESQLECVLPSFEQEANKILMQLTNLASSSASISSSPHLLTLLIDVVLDSNQTSNTLPFILHQPVVIQKIAPQYVLMVPPTTLTATLNLLKLSGRHGVAPTSTTTILYNHGTSPKAVMEPLQDITSLPVFVRIRQVSERTGLVSETTREARWKISAIGVYEIDFDAVVMGFGTVSVEITFNRVEFYRGKDKFPDSLHYHVHRDVSLESIEPCCISVTSRQMTEVRLLGDGFVDSGDLIVALLQKEMSGGDDAAMKHVAQLNATYCSSNELRCTVHANMSFGLTAFRVSLNGGKQYGRAQVMALLYRDRTVRSIHPELASLDGNSIITIHHTTLNAEHMDSPRLVQQLIPPRKLRVRFQALNDDGTPLDTFVKIVAAEYKNTTAGKTGESGVITCRSPSFIEEFKHRGGQATFDHPPGSAHGLKRFQVSIALGGDIFFGTLSFSYYFPPVIRSITQHHGPITGGTSVTLRMKYKVPPEVPILVRFLSLNKGVYECAPGKIETRREQTKNSPTDSSGKNAHEGDPAYLIKSSTPTWTKTNNSLPHLTQIQVSYNGGYEFVPAGDAVSTTLTSPRSMMQRQDVRLVKDMSYLYFLFYEPPTVNSILPMSADTQGGSYIRMMGENIVDHGAQVSVIFESPELIRKVLGVIEKGEIRCCAPPFNVGRATVYVSLNSEQYTKCQFYDPETKQPIQFVFYSSPSLTSISPMCASIVQPSVINLRGINLIETGRIKVRFGFVSRHGKYIYKDVDGRARNGVITANSPTFSSDYSDINAVVDVALNGNDFSGTTVSLYYFSSYSITHVEPQYGAFEVPINLELHVSPQITTDCILIRLRFRQKYCVEEKTYGPIEVIEWLPSRVRFTLPAISTMVESRVNLEAIGIDLSFDKVYFHNVGELLHHYQVYNIPHLTSVTPLYGAFDQETELIAHGVHLRGTDVVKITWYLELGSESSSVVIRPTIAVAATTNLKKQTLTWKCPSLAQWCSILRESGMDKMIDLTTTAQQMILSQRLRMHISTIDGQEMALPFVFRYYKQPTLVHMNPRVGYVCGGSLVSFEFREHIEAPSVDFRFGKSDVTSGRVRDGRFVECFSPELPKGTHPVSVSFNEQHFKVLDIVDLRPIEGSIEGFSGVPSRQLEKKSLNQATFQAFELPIFVIPDNRNRIYAFGPLGGGTAVFIKGHGFIAEAKIYIRFCSPYKHGFGENISEVVVHADVLDSETIQCVSPPSIRIGRVSLHLSYNLQEFTDSTCFFEYHAPTYYHHQGVLCGPVSERTLICLTVENPNGLPDDTTLINAVVRFVSEDQHNHQDVAATFDPMTMSISCSTPAWPASELVAIHVALAYDSMAQFTNSQVKFFFYDPPQGPIAVEPPAGPVSGNTEVSVWCGKIVDIGKLTVSITLCDEDASFNDTSDGKCSSQQQIEATSSVINTTTVSIAARIIGETVNFLSPSVSKPGVAYLNISFDGINFTSVLAKNTLRYIYYLEPIIRRVNPIWSSADHPNQIIIYGDHIKDYGCKPLIRLHPQRDQKEGKGDGEYPLQDIILDGCFIDGNTNSVDSVALQCSFYGDQPGYYEFEISLNGKQYSHSNYMCARFANYSGAISTALLPFRYFVTPFFLATPTGPAAGGSTVVLYLGKKLAKLLSKESRCQVQFTPIRSSAQPSQNGSTLLTSKNSHISIDPVTMMGDIDHTNLKVSCRAPLLRIACTAHVDILLPSTPESKSGLGSACTFFNAKEREKYYTYESPSISDITPSCGPMSGGTCLVLECTNLLNTGQIFVRFRSSLNERECIIIPGIYSRAFPDGSLSSSPLIICKTPAVEFVNKITSSDATTPSVNGGGGGSASTPLVANLTRIRGRTHTFQQMAEQSLNTQSVQAGNGITTLKITRSVVKGASRISAIDGSASVSVLVDFTLNGGEQFIAHSVPFQYYADLDEKEVKWFPRHLPTQSLDRLPTETRIITAQLPKTLRLTDALDRVSFYFEGIPQQMHWKRRGSNVVLHEMETPRELVVLDNPKLKPQSTMRRRSMYFRKSSISATSSNLLAISTATALPITVRARPMPPTQISDENKHTPKPPSVSSPSPTIYVAGKVTHLNEVTCPVPDFSCPGYVDVFFSLNSQQFVCLGALYIHNPVSIKDDRKFRFCSNIGGDRFLFSCSSSTIFNYLRPHDVKNEQQLDDEVQEVGLRRRSKALVKWSAKHDGVANENPDSVGKIIGKGACRRSMTSVVGKTTLNEWKERKFRAIQVHLYPSNQRLLKKVLVTASRVHNRTQVNSSNLDENGCCMFETTDWDQEMLIESSLPSNAEFSSFSAIITEDEDESICKRDGERNEQSFTPKTHLLMVHLPSKSEIEIIIFGVASASMEICFLAQNGERIEDNVLKTSACTFDNRIKALVIDMMSLVPHTQQYYICLESSAARMTVESKYDQDQGSFDVLVANAAGVQTYLSGSANVFGIWMISRVLIEQNDVTVTTVDQLVKSITDIEQLNVPEPNSATVDVQQALVSHDSTVSSSGTSVSIAVHFTCADLSRNLSCSIPSRLILPGSTDLQTLMSTSLPFPEVKLECIVPPLPFSGPTMLLVNFGGVTFSNAICIQCYDPRAWCITALDPPCGLARKTTTLRVRGKNFVNNQRILVRLSDASRYINVEATVEKIHLLIVQITAIKHIRTLMRGIITQGLRSPTNTSPQKRDDDKTLQSTFLSNGCGTTISSNFTLTVRIQCGEEIIFASCGGGSVMTAVTTSSVLGWEEQFELHVIPEVSRLLVLTVEICDSASVKPIELARAVLSLDTIKEGELCRTSCILEEHFKHGYHSSSTAQDHPIPSEIELLLHLSPLIQHPDYVVCTLSKLDVSQKLNVQISSDDAFFFGSEDASSSSSACFHVYELPNVTHVTPQVLPRSTGGEIVIHGDGFIDCNTSTMCVRLFACTKNVLTNSEEWDVLSAINQVTKLQPANENFFIRDVPASVVSTTSVTCVVPANLASYNVFFRMSFDGKEFTKATTASRILMFSVEGINPKGGPVSGNTYAALHGTNIHTCLSLSKSLTPMVHLSWIRGARELESVIVPGEFYPPEDIIYFYSPQSRFGLHNITVIIELSLTCRSKSALVMNDVAESDADNGSGGGRFSQDGIHFVMYKIPSIKAISPTAGLLCGNSSIEMLFQGLDERATWSLKHAHKARFKRRGQMQVSDIQLVAEGKFICPVPRFNVNNASAIELPATNADLLALSTTPLSPSSPTKHLVRGGGLHIGEQKPGCSLMKIWNRESGIFITLLRARNLHVSKKNLCNPFAIVQCGKSQLRSTRKEGTFTPVWNELFDFEWKNLKQSPVIRIGIENQVTLDQSELLGRVEISFSDQDFSQAFSFRGWFPLRKSHGGMKHKDSPVFTQQHHETSIGDIEVAIAYRPIVPINNPPKFRNSNALKSAILSKLANKGKLLSHTRPEQVARTRKEKILRVFRSLGAPSSTIPNEVQVELALNGQDFWSVAPSSCYTTLTSIVLRAEPTFISVTGGSSLTIFGVNFVNSGSIRVAFAVICARSEVSSAQVTPDKVLIVDAKYRSNTSIYCVTPSFVTIADEDSRINIYVSINGLDFDSIAIPRHLMRISQMEDDVHIECDSAQDRIVHYGDGRYVVDKRMLWNDNKQLKGDAFHNTGVCGSSPLEYQLRIYLNPIVTCVRPADGIYTSQLTVEGKDFTPTNCAIARFCSKFDENDIRTSPLAVLSKQHMECTVPDFPRGTLIKMYITMNGVEFFPCPGEFKVFQSPRLTEIYPNWVSAMTQLQLVLRGINLTAPIDNPNSVQVSFTRTNTKGIIVHGTCVDGEVMCAIPSEMLQLPSPQHTKSKHESSAMPIEERIMIDICLGGHHKKFTGKPLPLHVYQEAPRINSIAPMNGPVYGGFPIIIEGRNFINTGSIRVRFQPFQEKQDTEGVDEENQQHSTHHITALSPAELITEEAKPLVVEAVAKFVSPERLLCSAPMFPHEGVYLVLVALNGVEFTEINATTWFLVWQNWQKRKKLLSHDLFSHPMATEMASKLLTTTPKTMLDEEEIHQLRRKSSFMLPKVTGGDDRINLPIINTKDHVRRQHKREFDPMDSDDDDDEVDELVNLSLLHWHPASSIDEKGRSLVSMLENLCNDSDTQKIICRRLRIVFRLKGSPLHTDDEQGISDGANINDDEQGAMILTHQSFGSAIRLIFPHALDRELDDLWYFVDRKKTGRITYRDLMRKLLRPERSRSPEPGPTHYDPQYSAVEPRESAAIILPEVNTDAQVAGLPSEFFMDYDAFKAVKPRSIGTVFSKRKFNTSWCNPVPKEERSDSNMTEAKEPPPPTKTPRPPPSSGRLDTSQSRGRMDGQSMGRGQKRRTDSTQDSASAQSDDTWPRDEAIPSKTDSARSPRSTLTKYPSIAQRQIRATRDGTSPMSHSKGKNLFYNDIAPLYLKFLNSKEANKTKKQFIQD